MQKTSPGIAKIAPSGITSQETYLSRRALLAGGLGLAGMQTIGCFGGTASADATPAALKFVRNTGLSVADAPNSYKDITTYNNYYEFGTAKTDPAENAPPLHTQPFCY